ncbi:RNA dependent RNA polymerase-domain-containing protein [Massariosphaeria phaeospora]|uniref:RNA-dependent RNA polymerase n=1 Tax=Massariosphaeria phaeospora TaxID=100035 RepID=A0A7C8I4X7_9PLEO|nr:RNA dependent RNA polymerase-domain-containing protein [Massariosphaeria phaeospora]
MIELTQHVKVLYAQHQPDIVAQGIRSLSHESQTTSPFHDVGSSTVGFIMQLLKTNIEKSLEIKATLEHPIEKQHSHHHLATTYKSTVTPTALLLRGPDPHVSNRILRKYSAYKEYFMRVFFADEDGLPISYSPWVNQSRIHRRFHMVLQDGIRVAGRTHEFLGYSSSSLKYQVAWFVAPFKHEGRCIEHLQLNRQFGDVRRGFRAGRSWRHMGGSTPEVHELVDFRHDCYDITAE